MYTVPGTAELKWERSPGDRIVKIHALHNIAICDIMQGMHIISQRRIKEATQLHKTCTSALDQWYKVMKKAKLKDFAQLKALFNGADKVGDLYVFNIGGNKLRLIAAIHFNHQKVFIREILTHTEYDQGKWRS